MGPRHASLGALRRATLCIAIIAGTVSGGARAEDSGLYLFRIDAQRLPGAWPAAVEAVALDMYVPRSGAPPAGLRPAERFSGGAPGDGDAPQRIAVIDGATLGGEPTGADLEASFVIDYDEAAVATLVREVEPELGAEPSMEALARFVDRHIPRKSYRRGFSVASQVAASGEGDCTEHAVLLTALARARGWPARLAFGLLLVERPETFLAFGHAWTEIYDGRRWQVVDATRPAISLPDARLRYLPLLGLDDEGPGYGMSLMSLTTMMPKRVVQVAPAAGGLAEAG